MRTILILSIFFITSCASNEVDNKNQEQDVIVFSKEMIKNMTSTVDKLLSEKNSKEQDFKFYRKYYNEFYPVRAGKEGVKKSLINFCQSIGGVPESIACKRRKNTDQVLFIAQVSHTGRSSQGIKKVSLEIIAPNEDINNSVYQDAIRKHGYSPTEISKKINSQVSTDQAKSCAMLMVYLQNLSTEKQLGKDIRKSKTYQDIKDIFVSGKSVGSYLADISEDVPYLKPDVLSSVFGYECIGKFKFNVPRRTAYNRFISCNRYTGNTKSIDMCMDKILK